MKEHRIEDVVDYAALLEPLEVPLNCHEVPYDPDVLDRVVSDNELVHRYLEMQRDADGSGRKRELLVEKVAACARRILPLKEKLSILALLACGGSLREVGRLLDVPTDTVRRAVDRAIPSLASVLDPNQPLLPGGKTPRRGELHFFLISDESAAACLQRFLRAHPVRALSHAFDEGGVLSVCVLLEKC